MSRLSHRRGWSATPHRLSASVPRVPAYEPGEDLRRLDHLPRASHRLERLDLVRLEVAGVPVDLDTGAQSLDVQLGVELGGVDVLPDAEGLHGAGRRGRQVHGPGRQIADRLLVADERLEPSG